MTVHGTDARAQAAPPAPAPLSVTFDTQDYRLKAEVIADGLRDPWSIAFADKDNALITEKDGALRLWSRGRVLPRAIEGTPAVRAAGQGGLLDVALDPDIGKNGWVYLSYSHAIESPDGPLAMTRIVRGRVDGGRWSGEQVLWQAKPEHYRKGGNHFGCRIVFDGKGHLYFCIGDRGVMNDAQSLALPNGKVHRINMDGTIPKDNPFASRADAYGSIFSYGNRNPQGMALDLGTGKLWATEHGPQGGDELNLIESGRNYGWPVITYGRQYGGGVISELTAKEGMEQPVVQWTPSPAMCGLDVVTGAMFPKWRGNLLAGALRNQEVKRLVVDNNKVTKEEIIFKNRGRVRDVVVAPDGAIVVVAGGRIWRVTPQ